MHRTGPRYFRVLELLVACIGVGVGVGVVFVVVFVFVVESAEG